MGKNRRSIKSLMMLVALVLVLATVMLAVQPAQASGVCPAPGTGLPGALNMILDAKMLETMIAHVPPQGWAGMATAVGNSSCS